MIENYICLAIGGFVGLAVGVLVSSNKRICTKCDRAEVVKGFSKRLMARFCPFCEYEKWQIKDIVDDVAKEVTKERV